MALSADYFIDSDLVSPEKVEAVKRMHERMPPKEIFQRVVASIPQEVPDGTDKPGWMYGNVRIMGSIGGRHDTFYPLPEGWDLSDIKYSVFFRQAARKPGDVAYGFAASVPLDGCRQVKPGEAVELTKYIPFDWTEEQVEAWARESFIALQKVIKEYCES